MYVSLKEIVSSHILWFQSLFSRKSSNPEQHLFSMGSYKGQTLSFLEA